jgi:RimJ/RimL family protein N-acetyltransferase
MVGTEELIFTVHLPDKSAFTLDVGEGAVLRPLQEKDVTDAYVDGLNDPRVARFLVAARRQRQTIDSVRAYVRKNWEDPAGILFGVFIGGGLRGTVRLYMIDEDARTAVFGIALFDPSYWGQGWGSRCIRRVADFAIQDLGLKRVFAASYMHNPAAVRCFLKAGFIRTPERDFSDDYDQWVTVEFDARRRDNGA